MSWFYVSFFSGVDLSQFRIPGVLQRFAGTYLIVASVHLLFAKTSDDNRVSAFLCAPHGDEFMLIVNTTESQVPWWQLVLQWNRKCF